MDVCKIYLRKTEIFKLIGGTFANNLIGFNSQLKAITFVYKVYLKSYLLNVKHVEENKDRLKI